MEKEKIPFEDLGNFIFDPEDNYPDFALKVAQKINKKENKEILICVFGEGMAMIANKINGIKASVVFNSSQVKNLKKKNDINILSLGVDYLKDKEIKK